VDNLVNGLTWKSAVQAASTTNGSLTTAYAAGQVLDGYTLVVGDRILLKNQTTASENGLWVVNSTGSPSRSADGSTGELFTNATVRINNGLVGLDQAWTLVTVGTMTVGTTSQSWVRSDSGTPYSAGAGLQLSSNVFSVVPGAGIIADGTSTRIDPSVVARKYTQTIGNGTLTAITVTHNLGLSTPFMPTVAIYDSSSKVMVETDVTVVDTNSISLAFASAPATGALTVVIIG
jgi:hypothetical protein